jgi:nucleoid DNA-binding protein
MKTNDLAKLLAKHQSLSRAEAADTVDRLVHRILTTVRHGGTAALPGLGEFTSEGFRATTRNKPAPRKRVPR